MTISEWLNDAAQQLDKAGIGTSKLDVLILLEDYLHQDRAHLLAHSDALLSIEQINELGRSLKRRESHEPLAYIRGKTEFYGRNFIITQHVLEPRPETETMIELLKKLPIESPVIADIGTGSGAIAITAKLELPTAKMLGTDIDQKCLGVAKKNAKKHKASVTFFKGDLLEPCLNMNIDIILANLPYVPNDFKINKAAMREPQIAIFGGEDGLDLYRKLFVQISSMKQKPKYIVTEALPMQHQKLTQLALMHGYKLKQTEDFISIFNL